VTTPRPPAAPDRLAVNEIFFSIQGESSWTGLPCAFVRLAYCNLRCVWCDAAYTFYEGRERTFDDILDTLSAYPCRRVEVTGGEPLAQDNCLPFLTRLCDEGWTVLLETSGSLDIARVDPRVHRIVDFKCPGSGMSARNRFKNVEHLRPTDEVKFVILDRLDYEWAKDMLRRHDLPARCPVLFSPVFGRLDNLTLVTWILDDGLDVRFQVQLHKYVWEPDRRGV
jgi:7-carboxy-7-deazaguanine synthase